MNSRVAECCFWLHRYVERVENTARLLRINRSTILDYDIPEIERWRPVVVVTGEQGRFAAKFDRTVMDDAEIVQEYLTWDDENPVSIVSSMRWARENARTMREVVSVDMWESLNDLWHWLRGGSGRRLFRTDRDQFYRRVRDWPHQFYGLTQSTIMHDEAYIFMHLGLMLERSGQTARVLDVKHHLIGTTKATVGPVIENASWQILLHTCSAVEIYHKTYRRSVNGPDVARLLLLEESFPRSTRYCVENATTALERIRQRAGPTTGHLSQGKLNELRKRLRASRIEQVLEQGLHDELTLIIDSVADICAAVQADYFSLDRFATQTQSQRE